MPMSYHLCTMPFLSFLFSVIVIGACGGDDVDAPVDGGPDGMADSGADGRDTSVPLVTPIAPPLLPAPSCPDGWRRVNAEHIGPGVYHCDPWPEVETPCSTHEVRLPGEAACRPVGATCPADGWPADLPAAGVVYVRPGATSPPDGTRDAPYPDTTMALGALPPGTTTLALAAGDYMETLRIGSSITVRGACPERTILRGPTTPFVVEGGDYLGVEDVSFVSEGSNYIAVHDIALTMKRIALDGVWMELSGPSIVLEDIVTRHINDRVGVAFAIAGAGSRNLRRVVIEDCSGGGISITGTGSRHLTDVYIRRVGGTAVYSPSNLALERVGIDGFVDIGIVGVGGGQMSDVVIRNLSREGVVSGGFALAGDWDIRGAHLARAGDAAIVLGGGSVVLRDTLIEGMPAGSASLGRGLVVTDDGLLTAERLLIHDVRDLGVLTGRRSSSNLSDITVLGVQESIEGGFGRCVHGQFGAEVILERARLEDCTEAAVTTSGGATATLRDVQVSRVHPTRCIDSGGGCTEAAGIGLLALSLGSIDAERFIIEDAALTGVIIVEEGDLDLRDGIIRGGPIGINVQDPNYDLSRVMDRVLFVDNGANLDSSALPLPAATPGTSP